MRISERFQQRPPFNDAGGIDRDLDNDGSWDYNRGGIDRDLDSDGMWDFGAGGIDRDVDVPY